MIALGRRLAACGIDAILALLALSILLLPFASLADPALWQTLRPLPLLWSVLLVLLSMLWRGNTPGKRWVKLQVAGTGCIICRELRRTHWLLLLGACWLMAVPTYPIILAGIALGLAIKDLILPLLRRAPEFPHNTTTGFQVIERTLD